ncbi:MAG: hypothetical protein Q8N99_07835 [Nanoarchaeota archaeon]|nr:hypothetical protein [Nanoarchaeota archaeon]
MNEIKYFSDRRKKLEKMKTDKIDLKKEKQAIEDHHILGKINSDMEIPLLKEYHYYISCYQNSLPIELREDKEIMALTSIIGFFDLGIQCLREFRELKIKNRKNEK